MKPKKNPLIKISWLLDGRLAVTVADGKHHKNAIWFLCVNDMVADGSQLFWNVLWFEKKKAAARKKNMVHVSRRVYFEVHYKNAMWIVTMVYSKNAAKRHEQLADRFK